MQGMLGKKGIRAELIPPRDARPIGVHTDGRTIYEMERFDLQATKANKVQVMDPDGNPKWRQHPTTGEKMYPVMVSKPVFSTIKFVLDRSPVGKVSINPHFEVSEEQRKQDAVLKAKREFSDKLASMAAERGIDPEDVLNRLMNLGTEPEENAVMFPESKGGGHWVLSDGSKFRGSKEEAEIAEAGLQITVPDDSGDEGAY